MLFENASVFEFLNVPLEWVSDTKLSVVILCPNSLLYIRHFGIPNFPPLGCGNAGGIYKHIDTSRNDTKQKW